jgi:hypothetical protein
MSDDFYFGLSPDRVRQLLECKPADGYKMPRWEDKVKAAKPASKPKANKPKAVKAKTGRVVIMTPQAIKNREAQAKWRAANRELHRQRVYACMKKRREKMKANGEKLR